MAVGDMQRGDKALGPLTEKQRRLVHDNIGLVGVHLRRHVPHIAAPRRDREWEDLFQEGCLGLIQSALRYRPDCGIEFAAYALPRIHNAVSRALSRRFSTIYIPPKRSRTKRGACDRHAPAREPSVKVRSLSHEAESQLTDRRRHDPSSMHPPRAADFSLRPVAMETVGERLREKYERAVRAAGGPMAARTNSRRDRHKLIQRLTEERLLVPDEESRTSLRQIARDTRSSFARVTQCEKQLGLTIRAALQADPEFRELQRRRVNDELGPDRPIDAEMERDLMRVSVEEFIRCFRTANEKERARMLVLLLEASERNVEDLILAHVTRLAPLIRERLWRKTRPSIVASEP